MREITAEELHVILLDIAKEFHRICEKYNIPYYMLGGTMLGAIRHKGFIPWDDDMDFGVPRRFFKDCINALQKELPSHYKIYTIDNSDYILNGTIKISDERTFLKEIYREDSDENIGVNIDIFPLDETNDNLAVLSKNKIIRILISLHVYKHLPTKHRVWHKKIVAYMIKVLFIAMKKDTIINIIEKYFIPQKGDYIANHYGAWGIKEIHHRDVMGIPTMYPFEDTSFYGVENYDSYLRKMYVNYMDLPPKVKRHLHIINMFWK